MAPWFSRRKPSTHRFVVRGPEGICLLRTDQLEPAQACADYWARRMPGYDFEVWRYLVHGGRHYPGPGHCVHVARQLMLGHEDYADIEKELRPYDVDTIERKRRPR